MQGIIVLITGLIILYFVMLRKIQMNNFIRIISFGIVVFYIIGTYFAIMSLSRKNYGFLGDISDTLTSIGSFLIVAILIFLAWGVININKRSIKKSIKSDFQNEVEISKFTKLKPKHVILLFEITILLFITVLIVDTCKIVFAEVVIENQEVRVYQGEGTYSGEYVLVYDDKSGENTNFTVDENSYNDGKVFHLDIVYVVNDKEYIEVFLDVKSAESIIDKSKKDLFLLCILAGFILMLITGTLFLTRSKKKIN